MATGAPYTVIPPRAGVDREYRALLHVAGAVDWRFELALVLAHETGHRIGAIRQLRWEDVDLERGRIRWRGSADKIGFEHTAPASTRALEALRTAAGADPGIWVLPSPTDPRRPCSRHVLRDWWSHGVRKAKLPPIRRRGWHSLRRKFATELKGVPLKDLCQLGGLEEPLDRPEVLPAGRRGHDAKGAGGTAGAGLTRGRFIPSRMN